MVQAVIREIWGVGGVVNGEVLTSSVWPGSNSPLVGYWSMAEELGTHGLYCASLCEKRTYTKIMYIPYFVALNKRLLGRLGAV